MLPLLKLKLNSTIFIVINFVWTYNFLPFCRSLLLDHIFLSKIQTCNKIFVYNEIETSLEHQSVMNLNTITFFLSKFRAKKAIFTATILIPNLFLNTFSMSTQQVLVWHRILLQFSHSWKPPDDLWYICHFVCSNIPGRSGKHKNRLPYLKCWEILN